MLKFSTPQGMRKAGRFRTKLKKNLQGQHATAYALIETGFTRPFLNALLDTSSDVDTRNARRKVYKLIDAISRLQTFHKQKFLTL